MDDLWRRSFDYWRGRFLRTLSNPGERAAWDTLTEAGGTPEDLELVLWSADDRDSCRHLPKLLNSFRAARDRVLHDIHCLERSFGELAKAQLYEQRAVDAVWELNGRRGRKKFESFSSVLSQFQRAV